MLPKGTPGYGTITHVKRAGMFHSGGELSIVVAKGGSDVSATGAFVLPFIGALTVVTTILAPYLIRYAWRRPTPAKAEAAPPAEPVPGPG